jgi:hypothetical protein
MAIHYTITPQDLLLRVRASGFDENLEEVMSYAQAVIDAAIANESKFILCDERELEYRLSTFDIYELAINAAAYSKYVVKIAIVVSENASQDARFYETVTVNRGLMVRIMTTIEEAEKWLKITNDSLE